MSGGRLAQDDRQRIASGLALGLGYAEIARGLGRPTSTVSREVARNGGPDGYRADRAHEATHRRARRPKPTTAAARDNATTPVPADGLGRNPDAVREFVERFAALMARSGVPRMAARVLAALITTDSGTLTAADLVTNLRVSPASVSKAVGFLEDLALLRRERDPRRRERYVVDDDVWLRTWTTDAERHTSWADTAHAGAAIVGPGTPAADRLDRMARFFATLSEMMTTSLTQTAIDDAWTILAALLHAGTPRTADQLATALNWPTTRVIEALDNTERHPDLAGPLTLTRTADAYSTAANPDRLTPAQRHALRSTP